jgi:hypothetical protein
MYVPFCRARYTPQVPDGGMISPIPAHSSCSHHSVDGDTGGFHSSQSVQDEHIFTKESSVGSYQTSPLENGSGNSTCSSDLPSNLSLLETGLNIEFSEHGGDNNGVLNFSGSPDFAPPSTYHSMLPDDRFRDWEGPFSTRPFPPDLHMHESLNQSSATESAGSACWSGDSLWDSGLLRPDYGPFPLEHRGL